MGGGGGSSSAVSGNYTSSYPANTDFYIDADGNPILNDVITAVHWAGFAIQALSTLAFLYLSKNAHDSRIYHYITAGCAA